MSNPKYKRIENIISIALTILIFIGVLLVILENKEKEKQMEQQIEQPVEQNTEQQIEQPVEVSTVEVKQEPELKEPDMQQENIQQEVQNETNLYNQIVENEYEGMIYYTESRFDTNNLYLPTKEVNPTSGKAGLCGLQNSTDNDVWSQDKLCEDYMSDRYGSWEAAWNFHEQNGWW